MSKPTLEKVCWIHCVDRRVLFVRSKDIDLAYTVGGKIHEGETREDALVREVKEEVSVDLIRPSISYLGYVTGQAYGKYKGWNLVLHCYTADFEGELTVNLDSEIAEDGMVWLTTADIPQATDPAKTTTTGHDVLMWLHERGFID